MDRQPADHNEKPTFMDYEVQQCPYALYDHLLEEKPVYKDPVTGFYVVTRYSDVRRILVDPETFKSNAVIQKVRENVDPSRTERVAEIYNRHGWLPAPSLSLLDDPYHKEVRAIFDKAFRKDRIKELDPIVERTAYELARQIAAKDSCEFVRDFAVPLPLMIIMVQMGAPVEDMWKIKSWTDAWIKRLGLMLSEEEEIQSVHQEIEAQHYFKDIIDSLRREPNDTVLSDLVNTPFKSGQLLSYNEIFSHLMADTFVGGSETTTNALSAGLKILCEKPELYDLIASDPEQHLRGFTEEVLRLESPVQGLFRVPDKDVEIQGVKIPKGSIINIKFAAANRDPRRFECPAELVLDRKSPASHLTFGAGSHHCLGAPLARRELYWGFKAIFDTFKGVRLAPGNDFTYTPSVMLRALERLNVQFVKKDG